MDDRWARIILCLLGVAQRVRCARVVIHSEPTFQTSRYLSRFLVVIEAGKDQVDGELT